MKRVLSTLLAAVVVISALCAAPASAADKKVSRLGFISLAYEYLDSAVDSGLPFCNWNEESSIDEAVPLYSPDGEIIGYDFGISTNGEPDGYVRIVSVNGKPRAVYNAYGGKTTESEYSDDMEGTVDGRFYLVNVMTIAVKTNSGYKVLGWGDYLTAEKLKESYNYTVRLLEKSGLTWTDDINAAGRASINTVLPEAKDYSYCIWSDFKNIYVTDGAGNYRHPNNSCTPIAATNVLRYFRHTGASDMPHSYTNEEIFMTLYFDMDTNNHSVGGFDNPGTPVDNILNGLKKTCAGLAAGTPTTAVKGSKVHTALSSSTVKSYIDDGYMLIASVIDYKDEGAHSLVIYGYDSSNYYIADGLNRSIDSISISNLEVYHFVAVKF